MRLALTVIGVISTMYALGLNLSYVVLWPFARIGIGQRIRQRRWSWYEEAFASPQTPGVSIVVPAHNEQSVVLESIQSLLSQRYPRFELVLVDDGSDDATARTVIAAHGLHQVAIVARNIVPHLPWSRCGAAPAIRISRWCGNTTADEPMRSTAAWTSPATGTCASPTPTRSSTPTRWR